MRTHNPRAKKRILCTRKARMGPQHVLALLLSHVEEEEEGGRSPIRIAISIFVSLLTSIVEERKLLIDD
jgi:hypothetical protein